MIILTLFAELGVGLCNLFNIHEQSAPTVIIRCTEELELRGRNSPELDLYNVYRCSPSRESLRELCSSLSAGKTAVFVVYYIMWRYP